MGCRASDHALSYCPFELATDEELETIFAKALKSGESFTVKELDQYRTALLQFFGEKYAELGWAMELHFGAMRNNNTAMLNKLGLDTGYDSISDTNSISLTSRLLSDLPQNTK